MSPGFIFLSHFVNATSFSPSADLSVSPISSFRRSVALTIVMISPGVDGALLIASYTSVVLKSSLRNLARRVLSVAMLCPAMLMLRYAKTRLSIVHLCAFSILMISTSRAGVINGCTFWRPLLPTGRPLCFGLDDVLPSEARLRFNDRVPPRIGLLVGEDDEDAYDDERPPLLFVSSSSSSEIFTPISLKYCLSSY